MEGKNRKISAADLQQIENGDRHYYRYQFGDRVFATNPTMDIDIESAVILINERIAKSVPLI